MNNSRAMISGISRDELDQMFFESLRAVYQFERIKVMKFGLNYEAIYILQFLRRRSSARMKEIAREMIIPVSTATRLIDRLQIRGLVKRRKDPDDKRSVLVFLEPDGEKIVQKVEDHTYSIIMQNLKPFTESDLAAFIKTSICLRQILRV